MTLDIDTSRDDGTITVTVRGEIDMTTAEELDSALAAASADARIVLDLTGVTYLDSAGVKVLYDHVDRGPELVLAPDAFIRRVLSITGLDTALTVRAEE